MKIFTDKIEALPPHRLSRKDIKRILETVPSEWLRPISEIRLSNSLELSFPWARLSRYDRSLTIYCRRGTRDQALTIVLTELAADFLAVKTGYRPHRSKAEKTRIHTLIQPYLDKLLPEISPPPNRKLITVPDSSFRAVRLNNGMPHEPLQNIKLLPSDEHLTE